MELPENFFDIEFGKAIAFGYRTGDVDEFVTKAVEIIHGQQEEIEILLDKMAVLAANLEKYREEEDSLRSALIGAQKLGDSILKDSKSKAEIILREATTEANHLMEAAQARMEKEQLAYNTLKAEVSAFREQLINMYRAHVEQITQMPHEPEKPAPAEKETAAVKNEAVAAEPRAEVPTEDPTVLELVTGDYSEEALEPRRGRSKRDPSAREFSSAAVQLGWGDLIGEEEPDSPEDVIITDFESKVDRIITRSAKTRKAVNHDMDDQQLGFDEAGGGPVISPKFGVLKFGESFDLKDDDIPRPRSK